MNIKKANVLVTGGAGFIGSHLVDALMERSCRVLVLDNMANGKEENLGRHFNTRRFKLFKGDMTDRGVLKKAMNGIDIVFHMACLGVRHSIKKPLENHWVNSHGALLTLMASKEKGIKRFIHCSSSEVYGTAQYVPMPEGHPTHPSTVYGASKLSGEAYTRAFHNTYGLKTVIIRPFNTYGPRSHHEGDAGEMIPKSIVRAINHKPIVLFGDGSQTRDYTYVADVVDALIKAAECEGTVGHTFNIGSSLERSILDIAGEIFRLSGIRSGKIRHLTPRPGDVLRLCADASKFRDLTGWSPRVSLEDGLKRTIEWFKSRPGGLKRLLSEEKAINWE